MLNFERHLISVNQTIKEALVVLNILASDAIVFVVDKNNILKGSLTDGDVRRALIKGVTIDHLAVEIVQENPKFIIKGNYDIQKIIEYREGNYLIIPVVDKDNKVVDIINFGDTRSYLPVDAMIMAGGLGSRLKPLTDNTPKPLLKIGGKPIVDYAVDHLRKYGIKDFWLSLGYLGNQLEEHFGNGKDRNLSIKYIWEDEPLGTIGALSKIETFEHDFVLIMNSDILSNFDLESFFIDFIKNEADMSVITIPYHVNVPYAVMETSNNSVISFKEKPTYTYYSNGGIYLVKKEVLKKIPKNQFYNSTDLMHDLIKNGGKLISFPIREYWLDIGKHEDFEQAQKDVKHIKF